MDQIDEIDDFLVSYGLDLDEIFSIKSRNKYLKVAVREEAEEVLLFFANECRLDKKDIRKLVINNPFILTESMQRIYLLKNIYSNIGFVKNDYKQYINSFDKAFSLNPKTVFEKVSKMAESGRSKDDIKMAIINDGYKLFG